MLRACLSSCLIALCLFSPTFGAGLVGDGVTDDTAAFQELMKTAGDGALVKLTSGRVFRITSNITRDRAIKLESTIPGKPATIRYDFDPKRTPPSGRTHLTLTPKLGKQITWKEKLDNGQRPRTAPSLDPKRRYIVAYGTNRS